MVSSQCPHSPSGGEGTNGTAPVYRPMSDFDYPSCALALYQTYAELALFRYGLQKFSDDDFAALRLNSSDRCLLQSMAQQLLGHATVMSNMLGPEAPVQCSYNYPVSNLQEYIDFGREMLRSAESAMYGFLNHLNSRAMGQLLLQSVATGA